MGRGTFLKNLLMNRLPAPRNILDFTRTISVTAQRVAVCGTSVMMARAARDHPIKQRAVGVMMVVLCPGAMELVPLLVLIVKAALAADMNRVAASSRGKTMSPAPTPPALPPPPWAGGMVSIDYRASWQKGLQMHHTSCWTLMPLRPRLDCFPDVCTHIDCAVPTV